MRISGIGATDIGRKRQLNEDYFICDNETNIYLVADGMGGVPGGELASKMAVDAFLAKIQPLLQDEEVTLPFELNANNGYIPSLLKYAIEEANSTVYQYGFHDPSKKGMGTTFTAAITYEEKLYVGHIGDTRLYRVRSGKIVQLSEDHTLVQQLVKDGHITPKEACHHPKKNVITRSLGPKPKVKIDILCEQLIPGDIYLLCSDGLYEMVEEEDFSSELLPLEGNGLESAGKKLIKLANKGGGKDNITLVLFRVEE
jgi:protein phosphatase